MLQVLKTFLERSNTYVMYDSLKKAKLLARQVYVDPWSNMRMWCGDPSASSKIYNIQNSKIHFIRNLKRRTESVSKRRTQLPLRFVKDSWKSYRLCFWTRILQNEDQESILCKAYMYDDVARDGPLVTVATLI